MRHVSFRELDQLCRRLLSTSRNTAQVDKVLRDGIRQRLIDKDTLPLVLQRVSLAHGDWSLALGVLQSHELSRHRIRLDENLWPLIMKTVPPHEASQEAAQQVLRKVLTRPPPRQS